MSLVLEPGEGKKLSVLGLQFTAKVGNSDAKGAFCLNEVVVPEAPPYHSTPTPTKRSPSTFSMGSSTSTWGTAP